ncbi:YncE family protein [Altericroceibacterium endophyticum]|uniref:YncE family protein n=1 Tax=Altericroceibacterium endophyticum TaxID=1808508 RepID=A0A6I4T6C3_9SPHN|nr:YncE family protein [Altericroceibacterium endophyticum]MXO65553.1 YncE family protein [Altericroceibacterium endophyticum]
MKKLVLALLSASVCACTMATAEEPVQAGNMLVEKPLPVPGFADFLAVDGDTVWVTNVGRVEQWGVDGKLASTDMPRPCGTMSVANYSLWVANCTGGNLYRIDVGTAEISNIIETGIANPKGETNVVAGAGSIWVPSASEGQIARVDPATNAVIATVSVDPDTFYLAYGFDALWAVSSEQRSLQKIDPATNSVVATVSLGQQPGFLAAGAGGVWVQEQGDGTVARVNPDNVEVTGRVKVGESLVYGDIDTGGGSVWLRTTEDQVFAVIDPATMEVTARLGTPAGSGAIRYTDAGVWTSAHDDQTISWWSH